MINRSNYEEYFLDYFDGSLSEEQKQQLFEFLSSNPDLKAEFDRFSIINVPKEKVFFDKDALKKNAITRYNYKTWFIAYVEDDLSAQERTEVERFIEVNPGLQKEFELFRNTKLQPDYNIRFGNKNLLKKGAKVISINAWVYRTAALAASIAIAFFLFYYRTADNGRQVATTETRKETKAPVHTETKKETQAPVHTHADAEKKAPNSNNEIRNNDNKIPHQHNRPAPQQRIFDEPSYAGNNKQQQTTEQPALAENKQPVATQSAPVIIINQEKPTGDSAKPFSVFTVEELAELGAIEGKSQEQSLFNKAAGNLGKKLFGNNARLENRTNEEAGTQTFALAAGNFEFSRTIAR
jgi:hypothetical protein